MLLNDLRYTARMMRKAPVFTASVVLTVALGIGATTIIFSVVNAVILRPLPFNDPARLMQVAEKNDRLHLPNFGASVLNYLSWKEQTHTFEQLGAIGFSSFNLSGRGDPEQFTGSTISPSLMPILGLHPVRGRAFADGEDAPAAAPVVMIGEGLWRRRFGADASLVGSSLTLNGVNRTVVGIAPAALAVLTGGDFWIPLTIDPGREMRLNHVITVVGRLRPGVTIEQAQAEMDAIAARVGQQYPEVRDWGINLVTFYRTFVNPQLQTALVVLLAAVGFVLLIACANVANLLLARAGARQREIAVRTAMGASRGRLLRQMLVESLVFSTLGGAAGLLVVFWAVPAMSRALPPNLLPIPEIPIDTTVLIFAAIVTLATGLVFGLAPALATAKTDLGLVLKAATRSATGGIRPRLRNGLAALELALATVLLVGAGLLAQTLVQLQHVRLGFEPSGLITFQISLPPAKYDSAKKGPAFYRELLESMRSVPGVTSVALSSGIPLGAGNYTTSPASADGSTAVPEGTPIPIDWRTVSPGFFRTMNIPLLRGREFTDADGAAGPATMIISQATARRFWGNADPIGRTMRRVADNKPFTVVGLVGDVRNAALNQESPSLYYPAGWRVWPLMDIVVRTDTRPETLMPALRQKVRAMDPEVPVSNVRPMTDWVSANAAQPRLNALLLGVFACVALLLAAIGVYGVLAYSVSLRTREIGLRLALGAQPASVVRLIVREGMIVGAIGIAIGLAGALALSRALSALVFGVTPRDPLTFLAVVATLGLVACAACAIPARRAARVDPMVALREE